MYLLLYCIHLQPLATSLPIGPVLALGALSLVLTIPSSQLMTPWFIGFLALANLSILLGTVPSNLRIDPGMICALALLLAMTSYIPSIPHFATISCLLVAAYGAALYRADLLQTDAVLFLTALLGLTLVFLSKMGFAQAQMQRMTETHERSRQESMIDPLTGLPNRAQFLDHVSRSVQYGQNTPQFRFAVLFIDLDGFKPINDTLGHKAGDAVLRHAASIFKGCLRKGDIVARYGGDEFTFFITNVKGSADAIHVAERVLAKIQTPVNVGEIVKVGASIGIALSTNLHERAEDLIRDADDAMYRAKARGKNCYVLNDQAADIPTVELKARWKRIVQLKW